MRILLVSPPWSEIYGKFRPAAKARVFRPPLGLCYLSACLKRRGYDVKVLDAEERWMTNDQIADYASKFDVAGITTVTPIFHVASDIIDKIRERSKDVFVIIGGPHTTVLPDHAMKNSTADIAVIGEGEITIQRILCELEKSRDFSKIKGVVFRRGKELVKTEIAPVIENLDSLPFPDRCDLGDYYTDIPKKGIVRDTSILSSRGCPFQCIFCSAKTVMGMKMRFRSPENVACEMEEVVKQYGIRHFSFLDDTLTLNRDRIVKICDLILDRGLDITWEGWTRANLVDRKLLQKMVNAGFVRISFGIETGDPQIMKVIKKGIKLDDIPKAYELCKEFGIETRCSVMLGHPYETHETVMKTLRFIRNLKNCDHAFISITVPYPGTELWEMAMRGEGGMQLLIRDFKDLKRYSHGSIEVNDLSKEELVRLQQKGYLMFYLTPRRVFYNLRRAGLKAAIRNTLAFGKSIRCIS